MSEAAKRRRNRRTSGWAEGDVALAQKFIAYWEHRMDRLRVHDVAQKLEKMVDSALQLAAWIEQVERAPVVPHDYAKKAFGLLARHQRGLATQLKAHREKLGWCFHREARREAKPNE